jgi:hypothetical protein
VPSQILQNPALAPFRAKITALDTAPSPAIVTPKVPPSPVITPEVLAKNLEKPLILQNHKAGEIPAVVTGLTPQKLPVISLFNPATILKCFSSCMFRRAQFCRVRKSRYCHSSPCKA